MTVLQLFESKCNLKSITEIFPETPSFYKSPSIIECMSDRKRLIGELVHAILE